ncbi:MULTISPECIES: hypothetical protein [Cupriavidus]|uniref:Uncharacterized protein n=1 Tax=Cupriavidus basilensis TaxID=68895 RepID=A0A643FR59_9BURK|nr:MULTISPECIES: hypothetical protein [Cupriavidus]NOV23577.1 hypothetical protein [Cupriavidus necator]QOT81651.1 hypothetical protein F7R26_037180 [Cupriavidus basilensis]BDB30138.1 hypothetical protein CTP10_R75550 [Cupriavidus sp. P-10]
MTTPIKVTFTSTAGEEINGQAQFEPMSELVTLPSQLLEHVQRARAACDGHALVAHEDGYRYPLQPVEDGVYQLDRSRRHRQRLLEQAWKAVTAPTKDQRQQSGRFAHTLSAAALIGASVYVGYSNVWMLVALTDVLSLVGVGAVLFLVGAVLSKGD